MKKDLSKHDERNGPKSVISKSLPPRRVMPRAGWSESSKAIAKHGDDYLILGEFPNLEDKDLEW